MTRKISKKNAELFTKRAIELIKSFDHEEDAIWGYHWTVHTSIGKLFISVPVNQSYIYTIFMMFDETERAKKYFECNPYSGKYNIHVMDMEEALRWFHSTLIKAQSIEQGA